MAVDQILITSKRALSINDVAWNLHDADIYFINSGYVFIGIRNMWMLSQINFKMYTISTV